MNKILLDTYQKFGYMMFDCSLEELEIYKNTCYLYKKPITFEENFSYVSFNDLNDAVHKINSFFIPKEHGFLPKIKWTLENSNQLLVKEIWFYNYQDRYLYQCAVERAWALGNHLDKRVKQIFYD